MTENRKLLNIFRFGGFGTACEHNFSSIEEGFQRIKPKEYFHFMKENKGAGMWSHVFVIGFNPKLPPRNITYLDISYSIKNVIFPNLIKAKLFRFWAPNSYELKLEGNNNSKIDIINKNSNVIVNLPQDRYHYSQLMSPPNPPPATTVILGNTPSMTWFYSPDTPRISSIIVIYKIQEDSLVKTLDDTIISMDKSGNIALLLGFVAFLLAIISIDYKLLRINLKNIYNYIISKLQMINTILKTIKIKFTKK